MPRPVHRKKDPVKVAAFRAELCEKLHAQQIALESSVHLWVMDDCLARTRVPFLPEAQMQVAGGDKCALVCSR